MTKFCFVPIAAEVVGQSSVFINGLMFSLSALWASVSETHHLLTRPGSSMRENTGNFPMNAR